jgi:hypothetical protein
MQGDHVQKFLLKDRKGVERGILSWSKGGDALFPNCYQHFPHQMKGILRHQFWNKSSKEKRRNLPTC